MKDIEEIKKILKGETRIVRGILRDEMTALASELRFEEAQYVKERLLLLDEYMAGSEVVNSVIHNVDVFSSELDEDTAYVNYLHVVRGCITQAFTFEYDNIDGETKEEVLQLGIAEMRERYKSEIGRASCRERV